MENVISNLDYFEIISKYLFTDDITNVNKIFPNLNYYPPDGEEINDFYASQENINKLKGRRIKSLRVIKADKDINWDGVYIEILYVSVDLESIPCLNTLYCDDGAEGFYVNCDKPVKKLCIYDDDDELYYDLLFLYLNLGNSKTRGINLRCIDGNEIITDKILIKDLSFDRLEDFKKLPLSNIFILSCDFYNEIFESLNNLAGFNLIINTVPKVKAIAFENIKNYYISSDGKKFYDFTNLKKLTELSLEIISDLIIKVNKNVKVYSCIKYVTEYHGNIKIIKITMK